MKRAAVATVQGNGHDLRSELLTDRRRRLRDLIGVDLVTRIAFSGDHAGDGPASFKAAEAHGLEGIVSKRADTRYQSGRSDAWLKVKSFRVGDYAMLGVERSTTGIPVALLATLGRDPAYVGNAMVTLCRPWSVIGFGGLSGQWGKPLARLAGLTKNKKATWIKEGLVARVRHLRGEDMLRHATIQSLDVSEPRAGDVVRRHRREPARSSPPDWIG